MIIDLLTYVQDHRNKIIKSLKRGSIPTIMAERLHKRATHCMTIMTYYANNNPNVYSFSLTDETHDFGNPLEDFLTYWTGNFTSNNEVDIWWIDPAKNDVNTP